MTRLTDAALAAVLVAGAFVTSLAPVADGDIFWHLAAGREMTLRHAWLRVDPFSVSAAGRPWPDVHWLFQLGAYGVHQLGGLRALVLAKSLLIALGALLLFFAVPRRGRPFFVPAFLVALLLGRHLLLVRPVVLTFLFTSVFYLLLERYSRERRAMLLAPLPLVQLVWTNVQGLFALGPAIIGAYLVGALASAAFAGRPGYFFAREGRTRARALLRARHLGVTATLTAVASLASPFGSSVVELPARLLGRILPTHGNVFSEAVAENVPPFVLERSSPAETWHVKWFLVALGVLVVLSARRATLAHVVLVAGFVALALVGNRNVALLYWLAPAVVAADLAPRLGLVARRPRVRVAARVAVPVALAGVLTLAGVAVAREPSIDAPAPFRFPEASASMIERARAGGDVFAADHQGGYLIWRLFPRFRPYIDTRLILRTGQEYREYLKFADDPATFDDFRRRHGFVAIVLPVAYPDRYLGLVRHLYASRDLKLAYTDGSEVLFLKREGWGDDGVNLGDPRTTARLVENAKARFGRDRRLFSAAVVQLATLDMAVGELGEAAHALEGMDTEGATALLARVRVASGDLDGAERLAEQALAADAADVRALDVLSTVSARRGELVRASGYLRRALAVDPFDVEAENLLAIMEEHQHER